ncbi:hypothetical protein [Actinomadura soli]|uniref:hypothetical protein n=1 Tax=Actinomadura soli TaxID=2508997 RepID=UPI001486BCF8|nr:hypothetical protein [Actinomadura soli]
MAVSRHDATLFTCGNSYTTSVDATYAPQRRGPARGDRVSEQEIQAVARVDARTRF